MWRTWRGDHYEEQEKGNTRLQNKTGNISILTFEVLTCIVWSEYWNMIRGFEDEWKPVTVAFYFKAHGEMSVSIEAGQWLDAKVGVTPIMENVLPTNSDFFFHYMHKNCTFCCVATVDLHSSDFWELILCQISLRFQQVWTGEKSWEKHCSEKHTLIKRHLNDDVTS